MPIDATCPEGHKLKVPDRFAGTTVRCPKCSAATAVPEVKLAPSDLEIDTIEDQSAIDLLIAPVPKRPQKNVPIREAEEKKPKPSKRPASKPPWLIIGGAGMALVLVGVLVGAILNRSMQQVAVPSPQASSTPAGAVPGRPILMTAEDRKGDSDPPPVVVSPPPQATPATPQAAAIAASAPAIPTSNPPDASTKPATVPAGSSSPQPDATPPPRAARPQEIVTLPAPLRRLAVGGSGRYVISFLPSSRQVAILDVAAKQIVKSIPVDDSDVLVAAGETKLVILQRGNGIISRFDLESFEREMTVACEPYKALAMGSSSEGSLLALGANVVILDLQSLKPTGMPAGVPHGLDNNLLASANGKVFTGWRDQSSPSGLTILEIVSGTIKPSYEHVSYGPVLPSPDGRVIYTAGGKYGPDGKRLAGASSVNGQNLALPAVTGSFSISLLSADPASGRISTPTRLRVHCQNDELPILTATDVVLPDIPQNTLPGNTPTLPLHQRLLWLPNLDTFLTIPSSLDKFVIQHFNLQEELDKGGTDYLFVSSMPPTSVPRGQALSYQMDVLSKNGDVKYSLETGPPGMAISSSGLLSWQAVSDYASNEAIALVNIRDKSGQTISHTVKLSVVAPSNDVAVATQPAPKKPPVKTGVALQQKPPAPTEKRPSSGATASAAPAAATPRVRTTVPLPGGMQRPVIGGSGKYLITFIPDRKQVAVLDVEAKTISKLIPIDDTDVLIAAGETMFVVLQRSNGVISRYKLPTFERELTVACESYKSIALGSSSDGPLLTAGTTVGVLDLQTLKPAAITGDLTNANTVIAASNGKTFGCWNEGGAWSQAVLELEGTHFRKTMCPPQGFATSIRFSPDGRLVYSGYGRFSRDQPLGSQQGGYATRVLIPGATGPFYLSLVLAEIAGSQETGPTRLTIHCQNEGSPLFTATDVTLPEIPQNTHPAHVNTLALERRLFLLPAADALVTVPQSLDQFVIHKFNMKEELDRSGTDYFFVTTIPPNRFTRGQKLSYPIDVMSKNGNPQFKLESSPPGMTVSSAGLVDWDVPSDFSDREAIALVNIRDDSGQELAHTIKLTDGSTAKPTNPAAVAVTMPSPIPIQVPRTPPTPVEATAPKNSGKNQWRWTGPTPMCIRDEKGNFAAVRSGNNLYSLKPDGDLDTNAIVLSTEYMAIGLRDRQIVGLAANPTRLEILDPKGKEIRKVILENVPPLGLALHPCKPISYVSLDRSVGQFRGTFVAVDEQAGTVKSEDEQLGQSVVVDPTGRFLVSTYIHSVHVGDQVVVTQQQPRTMPVPRGIPRRGRYQPPMRTPPPPAPRVGVRHTYANVALTLVYDLDTPLQPEMHTVAPLEMPTGRLLISHDGRRMTSLARDSKLTKYAACNPLDFKAPPIEYDLAAPAGQAVLESDLTYHSLLPITIVAGAGTIRFLNSEDGKPISGKDVISFPDFAGKALKRVMTSLDGKHVVVLATGNSNDHILARAPLPLTDIEQKSMKSRAAGSLKDLKESAPPLTELTAFSGGIPEAMSAAEITGNFTDAVVIVRSGKSTGTGFFVGSSGLILTCAHCVSPLESVEIVYHPPGKPDEKETVEATVVHRDRKTDLALLKIDVQGPLHSVALADPIAVKSGSDVTIIANPGLGAEVLDNTVTTGIISNAKRTIEGNDYIQSSATVNPGSSGGPMFDRTGRVIGVVVLKAGIEGVGFAVPPASITKFLLKATRGDGVHGQLVRGWVSSSSTLLDERRLVRIEKGNVTLANASNGKTKTRPLSDFSAGDQKLLEQLAADE